MAKEKEAREARVVTFPRTMHRPVNRFTNFFNLISKLMYIVA